MKTNVIAKVVGAKRARGRPRRGDSKEKILRVATKMFADDGYSAVTIRDIAAACKLSCPSIYHFFGDKENLFAECCSTIFASTAEKLEASLTSPKGAKATVKRFTVALSEILLEDVDFRRLLQHGLLRHEQRSFHKHTEGFFVKQFSLLVKEIADLESLDTERARAHAFSIYALTFGLILLEFIGEVAGFDKPSKLSPAHLADRVLDIVLPHVKWRS